MNTIRVTVSVEIDADDDSQYCKRVITLNGGNPIAFWPPTVDVLVDEGDGWRLFERVDLRELVATAETQETTG